MKSTYINNASIYWYLSIDQSIDQSIDNIIDTCINNVPVSTMPSTYIKYINLSTCINLRTCIDVRAQKLR